MEKAWLDIFRKMTCGIYVLTTAYREEINGMIVSRASQVSYDPPLIMVAIHPNRYSHHLIKQGGAFALHVLARNQTHLLGVFKGPDPSAKFDFLNWSRGKNNCPILKDCLAFLVPSPPWTMQGHISERIRIEDHLQMNPPPVSPSREYGGQVDRS
jgi:flavin reductase (DIM6/NTAB) family NADH-FMN oxidoreductase RutF